MLITKTAWHRRVYDFTYFNPSKKPDKTSLCRYVWRIILLPIPIILCVALVYTLIYTCLIFGNIFYIAIGRGIMKLDEGSKDLFKVKNFEPMKIAGQQIDPYKALRLFWSGVFFVGIFGGTAYFKGMGTLLVFTKVIALIFAAIVVVLIVVFGLLLVISHARRSDTAELAKNYLQARKDKVCPIITFEE